MRAAGIGFRKNTRGAAIVAVVDAALGLHGLARADLDLIAVHGAKAAEPGLAEAAVLLGLPLVVIPPAVAAAHDSATSTRSARVIDLFGVGSMAETAALAAVGPGGRLLGPRTATPAATCAIAEGGLP